MLPLISFETGRKTQTQSSGQPDELRQQMEVWFYPRIETAAERPTPRAEKGKGFSHRRSSRAHQEAFCLLTRTYHRSPLRDSDQSSQLLISPNCVCDASRVPETCLEFSPLPMCGPGIRFGKLRPLTTCASCPTISVAPVLAITSLVAKASLQRPFDMAHRLARLVYRMLKYGQQYVDKGAEY
jgi:hypothetical protein